MFAAAALVALAAPATGVAAPENTYSSGSGVTLNISPHDLLPPSSPLTVTGNGFNLGASGSIRQCTTADVCGASLGGFNANGDGFFSAPATVTRFLTPSPPGPAVDCGTTPCIVLAEDTGEPVRFAGHHLDFAVPPGPLPPPPPDFTERITGLSASVFLGTGRRAAALRECAKIKDKVKRRGCEKIARKLPL